jgi:pilus assembly protein CpaB
VLISGNPPGLSNSVDGPEVRTLLQNIEVLSAGTDIQKDTEGKPNKVQVVNLLVAPEQAEVLSLASAQTHIQLVLRNPLDTETGKLPGTALSNLFGETIRPPAKVRTIAAGAHKPAPSIYSIVVFNGAQRSEQKFESHEEKQ